MYSFIKVQIDTQIHPQEFAIIPPSIVKALPVIQEESSLTKKRASFEMSTGLPSRFMRVKIKELSSGDKDYFRIK